MAEMIEVPYCCYQKYENGSMNLNNIEIIDKIINVLEIKDLERFPDYYKFIKTNPNKIMREYIEKNNLSIRKFSKMIGINTSIVHRWVKKDVRISIGNYKKLKNKYKKLYKEKEDLEL